MLKYIPLFIIWLYSFSVNMLIKGTVWCLECAYYFEFTWFAKVILALVLAIVFCYYIGE